MKTLIVLIITAITSVAVAVAQDKDYFQPNYDRYKSLVKPVPTPRQQAPAITLQNLLSYVDSVRYVAGNNLGDIYTLQQDNMPMLKPYVNGEAPMPGTQVTVVPTQPNMAGKIPNAVPQKKLILPAPPARK